MCLLFGDSEKKAIPRVESWHRAGFTYITSSRDGAWRGLAISTHSQGPSYPPGCRTLSLTYLLACHTYIPLAIYPADSGRAFPSSWRGGWQSGYERIRFPSREVWHFALRLVLPGVALLVGHTCRSNVWSPAGLKVSPKSTNPLRMQDLYSTSRIPCRLWPYALQNPVERFRLAGWWTVL